MENPFLCYAEMLSKPCWGGAETLQLAMMSMYNGNAHPFPLHKIGSLAVDDLSILFEMMTWYRTHGETDPAFLRLTQPIHNEWYNKKYENE